jgi:hypothetical protein
MSDAFVGLLLIVTVSTSQIKFQATVKKIPAVTRIITVTNKYLLQKRFLLSPPTASLHSSGAYSQLDLHLQTFQFAILSLLYAPS